MGNSVYGYRMSQEQFRSGFLANPPGGLTWDYDYKIWKFPGEQVPQDPTEQAAFLERRSKGDYRPYPADVDPRDLVTFHNEFVIDRVVSPEIYDHVFMNGEYDGSEWEPRGGVE